LNSKECVEIQYIFYRDGAKNTRNRFLVLASLVIFGQITRFALLLGLFDLRGLIAILQIGATHFGVVPADFCGNIGA
jgi:hypothetical protein